MSKPLTAVIKDAWDKLVEIITSDKKDDDSETIKPEDPNEEENKQDNGSGSGPIEPELNGGFGGI